MAVTAAQQKMLAATARRANRRLERATEGQRAYLEKQIKGYHTRTRESGARVFQQGKAASETEFRARMRELRRFLGEDEKRAVTSTRAGWESIKKQQVASAGETLRGQGYTITDNELAVILEEIDGKNKFAEMYSALANVEIAKAEQGNIEMNRDALIGAMNERRSAQERVQMLLQIRQQAKK